MREVLTLASNIGRLSMAALDLESYVKQLGIQPATLKGERQAECDMIEAAVMPHVDAIKQHAHALSLLIKLDIAGIQNRAELKRDISAIVDCHLATKTKP